MLFKMLGIERAYTATQPEDSEILSAIKARQIFVTHSRRLATYVEDYFRKLSMSLAATTKSKEELKEIAAQQKLQKENQSNSVLFDLNDVVTWKAGLPQRFSLLQDEHFPLFLTFERVSRPLFGCDHCVDTTLQLCQLLLGDVENAGDVAGTFRKGEAITYNIFFEQYWPHFSQDLTKSLGRSCIVFPAEFASFRLLQTLLLCSASYSVRAICEQMSSGVLRLYHRCDQGIRTVSQPRNSIS
jgi:hypothetical protein